MADLQWPARDAATVIGKPHDRLDGVEKSTGTAKYTYDINPPKMLLAKALACPHAHCRIKSVDTAAAKRVKGVAHVEVLTQPGDQAKAGATEIMYQGTLIAVVAAESEGAATEGVAAIKVQYEMLDAFVADDDLAAAEKAGRTAKGGGKVQLANEPGDGEDENQFTEKELARLFQESAAVVERRYGIEAITHMCLEPHGSTCVWDGDKLTAHLSTQNVSGTAGQFATPLGITADSVTVHCDHIGGGFGSKFAPDLWGVVCAKIARATGRPVKLMLDRETELRIAGSRPSGFIDVKVGADKEGLVTVWDSHHWGTGGFDGGGVSQDVIPYVFVPKNYRRRVTNIKTNTSPARAWRAPNHPQGCAMSQTAYDDIAARLGLDSYDVFLRNLAGVAKERAAVYAAEMEIAAKLIDWKAKWHAHGKGPAAGSVVSGLGMAIHTWGGAAHNSTCNLKVHPDGGVEVFLGSQELGTGTRTVIAMVVAETFGLPVSAVKVNIGSSKYPASGPSGGSTTVGGVAESSRRAAHGALEKLLALAAPKLEAEPAALEAKDRAIRVREKPDKSLSWKEACRLLGMAPLEVTGNFARGRSTGSLSGAGVAGVQMAEVEVDRETGVVKMKKFVAVQDMGLIINPKTAISQIHGAVIMGIAYALFEERIMDRASGAFLNARLADYRLPRLGDIGQIVVELYEPESERKRGVIGLGEPPVIAPGAAISNAVCNALGVRVPVLPMTPKRVLDALQSARRA